jgi:hypothetical protein
MARTNSHVYTVNFLSHIWFLNLFFDIQMLFLHTSKLRLCYTLNIVFILTEHFAGNESLFMNHVSGFVSKSAHRSRVLRLIYSPSVSKFDPG